MTAEIAQLPTVKAANNYLKAVGNYQVNRIAAKENWRSGTMIGAENALIYGALACVNQLQRGWRAPKMMRVLRRAGIVEVPAGDTAIAEEYGVVAAIAHTVVSEAGAELSPDFAQLGRFPYQEIEEPSSAAETK